MCYILNRVYTAAVQLLTVNATFVRSIPRGGNELFHLSRYGNKKRVYPLFNKSSLEIFAVGNGVFDSTFLLPTQLCTGFVPCVPSVKLKIFD